MMITVKMMTMVRMMLIMMIAKKKMTMMMKTSSSTQAFTPASTNIRQSHPPPGFGQNAKLEVWGPSKSQRKSESP